MTYSTLARSASEGIAYIPPLRFGLVSLLAGSGIGVPIAERGVITQFSRESGWLYSTDDAYNPPPFLREPSHGVASVSMPHAQALDV